MTAELPVVHLKIRHRATGLTPPAVAAQDLLAQTFVGQGVQPRGSSFGADHFRTPSHAGFLSGLLLFAGQELIHLTHRYESNRLITWLNGYK